MTAAIGAVGSAPAGTSTTSGSASWGTSWEAALTALELDVRSAERLLEDVRRKGEKAAVPPAPQAPWTPPAHLGPMPPTLVDRAKSLLERQLTVSQEIAEAIVLNRRQARAAAAVAQTFPRRVDAGGAVYVDISV